MTFTPEQAMDLTLDAFAPLGKDYVDDAEEGLRRPVGGLHALDGQAVGRLQRGRGLRRSPLPAPELHGQLRRRLHAGPRVGPLHALLPVQQEPALRQPRLLHLRRRGGLHAEREPPLPTTCSRTRPRTTPRGSSSSGATWTASARRSSGRRSSRSSSSRSTRWPSAGETLTGEGLTKLYLTCSASTTAHDKGVCEIDDLYGVEWAYIPHFYYNFYVYQYATSLVASTSVANAILDEAAARRPPDRDRPATPTSRCSPPAPPSTPSTSSRTPAWT